MAVSAGAFLGAAALSAGSGLFGSLYGSAKQYKQNAALMGLQAQLAYQYQRKLNRNAYQDATYSMRESGINPMLAINNGASGGSASVGLNGSQANIDSKIPALEAYSTAKQLQNENKRIQNETDVAKSTVNKQQYEADLAHEQSANLNQQTRLLDSYGDTEKQLELSNIVKQGQVLDAQRNNFNVNSAVAQINAQNQTALTRSNINYNAVSSRNIQQTTKNSAQSLKDAQRDYNYYKKHPIIYGINKTFGSASPLINSAVKLAK